MFNKLYEQIIEYIKKQYKFLLTLLIILLLFTIKLPYYIDMPGGAIDITNRIIINEKKQLNGSLNFAYVNELKATIPTLIIEKINPNWDLVKKEELLIQNDTIEEMQFRNEILMKESISNALYCGFTEAKEPFKTKNNKIYITSILKEAKTNLKVKDQIIKINNKEIKTKKDLEIVNNLKENETIEIKVLNNGKEYIRNAETIKYNDKIIIGVGINETFDIETKKDIKITSKTKESGPSGGMMMALTVYSYLTDEDITKGRKIIGTGTIDTNGNIGSIGGVKYKLIGAVKEKADLFLVPSGENYEEAMKIKKEKNYKIKIIPVSTLKETINKLKEN